MLPGMPKELKAAKDSIDDRQVAQVEAIIQSMTRKERADPGLIDGGRRKRIATGSGTTTQEVNQLLRQFKEAQQMMRSPGMLGGMLGGRGGDGERLRPSPSRWTAWPPWPPEGPTLSETSGPDFPGVRRPCGGSERGVPRAPRAPRAGRRKKVAGSPPRPPAGARAEAHIGSGGPVFAARPRQGPE